MHVQSLDSTLIDTKFILKMLGESKESSLFFPVSIPIPPLVEAADAPHRRFPDFSEESIVLPKYRGLTALVVRTEEGNFISDGNKIYNANFLDEFFENYTDDFVLSVVISKIDGENYGSAQDVIQALVSENTDQLFFNVYDLIEARGIDYSQEPWFTRQNRLKEMLFIGKFAVAKHRIAHDEESHKQSIAALEALNGVDSVVMVNEDKRGTVMAEGKLNVTIQGISENNKISKSVLTLELGDEKKHFIYPTRDNGNTPLIDYGFIPTVFTDAVDLSENEELVDIAQGTGLVSRWRDEGKKLFEFALNIDEHRDLNGVWTISESAVGEELPVDAMLYKIDTTTPYHERPAKSKSRIKEIEDLPNWQKPTQEAIEKFCGFDTAGKTKIQSFLERTITGNRWDVTIIEAGVSLNGNYWSKEVLQKSAIVFEGSPVNIIELKANQPDHIQHDTKMLLDAFPVTHTAGVLEKVRWSDERNGLVAEMVLFSDQQALKEKLLSAYQNGHSLFGLSVDVNADWHSDVIEGRDVSHVDGILDVNAWVDIVDNPSAGGRIHKFLESTGSNEGESRMDMTAFLATLAAFNLSESQVEAIKATIDEEKLSEGLAQATLDLIKQSVAENAKQLTDTAVAEATTEEKFKELFPNLLKEEEPVQENNEGKNVNEDLLNQVLESDQFKNAVQENANLKQQIAVMGSRENLREALDNSGLGEEVANHLFAQNKNRLLEDEEITSLIESAKQLITLSEKQAEDKGVVTDNGKDDIQESLSTEEQAKVDRIFAKISGGETKEENK